MNKQQFLAIGIFILFIVSSGLTGCIQSAAEMDDLGSGLTRDAQGRPTFDPDAIGTNLFWDGKILSAAGGGGSSTSYNQFYDHFNRSSGTLFTEIDGDNLDVNGTIDADTFDDGSLSISGGYIDFPGMGGGIRNCQGIELYGAITIGGDYVLDAYYHTLHSEPGWTCIDFYHPGVISFENNILRNITHVYVEDIQGDNATFTDNITIDGRELDTTDFTAWDVSADGNIANGSIWNSNHNHYPCTETGLNNAINNVGTYGWVHLGGDLTLTAEISMDGHDGVELHGKGHQITLSGDISFINITDCLYSYIHDFNIIVDTQTGGIIKLFSDTYNNRADFNRIENIHIINNGGTTANYLGTGLMAYVERNYTGILLHTTGDRIDSNTFDHITMHGAGIGIHLDCDGGYSNANNFNNIYVEHAVTTIYFDESGGDGGNMNHFNSVISQTNPITEYGFRINGNGNTFEHCHMYDWRAAVCPNGVYAYEIFSGGQGTKLRLTDYNPADLVGLYDDRGARSKIITAYGDEYNQDMGTYTIWRNDTHYFGTRNDNGELDYRYSTSFRELLYNILNDRVQNTTVFVKNGVYYWDSNSIVLADMKNLELRGENKDLTIIRVPDSTSLTGGMFAPSGDEGHMKFFNLCFDGNSRGGSNARGFVLTNCENITFDHCKFYDFENNSIKTDTSVKNIYITNCEFLNCGLGTRTGLYDKGTILVQEDAVNIHIKDNTFLFTENPSILNYVIHVYPDNGNYVSRLFISGNNIDHGGHANVDRGCYLNGHNGLDNIYNSTVTGNVFYADDEGLYLDNCENISINGNVCVGGVDGITIDASCDNIKPSTIGDTNIEHTG